MEKMEKIYQDFQNSIDAHTWTGVGDPNDDDYQEMVAVHVVDRAQLNQILVLFKNKKYKEAYQKAWQLDTLVREQIPKSVWDILYKHQE